MNTDIVLSRLDTARAALAEADTIQKTKKIVDVAAAAEIYARRQKLGEESVRYATSIKLEALRQLGKMLEVTPKNKGAASGGEKTDSRGSYLELRDNTPTLAEMGLDKKTSHIAQQVAKLDERQFEQVVNGVTTLEKAKRENQQKETRESRKSRNIPDGKYALIYADPPWRYDFSKSDSREIENQYPTMDVDEICTLPVGGLADDDCVLFMWATNPKLREALRVIEAWGFEYKTNMVWVKDKIGMGYYARQKHELLLIATKGSPGTPEPQDRPESAIFAERGKHSRKPAEFYTILETMYPYCKKIELFSRNEREGWDAWGNE